MKTLTLTLHEEVGGKVIKVQRHLSDLSLARMANAVRMNVLEDEYMALKTTFQRVRNKRTQ